MTAPLISEPDAQEPHQKQDLKALLISLSQRTETKAKTRDHSVPILPAYCAKAKSKAEREFCYGKREKGYRVESSRQAQHSHVYGVSAHEVVSAQGQEQAAGSQV